jgi:transaldolase
MNATRQLHDLGQNLWLDNTTRDLLSSGTHRQYIDELATTFPAAMQVGWQEESL